MKARLLIILIILSLTYVGLVAYYAYQWRMLGETQQENIPLSFLQITAIAFSVESVLFAIIFFRHFKKINFVLIPVFSFSVIVLLWSIV